MTGYVFAPGTPRPQGSARVFTIAGKPRITHANPETMPWRSVVAVHVRAEVGPTIVYPRPAGVVVDLEFVMPRRAAEKAIPVPHTRKPDRDKLERAVFDALSGLLFEDDSQVVDGRTVKRTALPGEQPGVHILWREQP